jgi:fructokinase
MKIGIDLGGTKIEGIALSDSGDELFRQRVPTPKGDYPAILQSISGLIAKIESETGQQGSIGIGTPGALSPATGLMRNSNSVCMNGKAVLDDLQSKIGRQVRIANDANCFALSEATDGAASADEVVFGVIIGTGTGAGIVVDRKVVIGPNAIAGEWGHNPLPWPQADELPGADCFCGRSGCIETWVSGPGMVRDHCQHNALAHSQDITPKLLVDAAEQGDGSAVQTMQRYERRLAKSLAHVINMLDPDAIVLGGGMGNIESLYINVPTLLPEYVFSDVVNTKIAAPVYGDSSGVRGAAWLWNR